MIPGFSRALLAVPSFGDATFPHAVATPTEEDSPDRRPDRRSAGSCGLCCLFVHFAMVGVEAAQ